MEYTANRLTAEEFIKQRNGIYLPGTDAEAEPQPIEAVLPDIGQASEPPLIQKLKREPRRRTGLPFLLLALTGLICVFPGFMLYGKALGELPREAVDSYLALRVNGGFFENASASFFGMLAWLAIPFFSGLCALGHPAALLTLPLKGIGTGMAAAYFITAFGANGLAAAAILILPSAVIGTLITAYQCRISLSCSSRLFSYITGRYTDARPSAYFGQYISRSLFCVLCSFGTGIIDGLISLLCGGMFVI